MSLLAIKDPSIRNYVAFMEKRIEDLERRMNRTVSPEGTIVAHLAQNTKKATPTGDKELTAGAIVILDDADDVPASATRKWA
ncbi:hypothetical protein LCGC14_2363970, partial [marine sediment metagenome]